MGSSSCQNSTANARSWYEIASFNETRENGILKAFSSSFQLAVQNHINIVMIKSASWRHTLVWHFIIPLTSDAECVGLGVARRRKAILVHSEKVSHECNIPVIGTFFEWKWDTIEADKLDSLICIIFINTASQYPDLFGFDVHIIGRVVGGRSIRHRNPLSQWDNERCTPNAKP